MDKGYAIQCIGRCFNTYLFQWPEIKNKSVKNCNGDYVKKGTPLIEIGGNDIVDLQKEYAEASAVFKAESFIHPIQ